MFVEGNLSFPSFANYNHRKPRCVIPRDERFLSDGLYGKTIMLLQNDHKYFLASIVESSQDSIVTINFDRVITSWNSAAESVYGYPAAEAIGKPLTMLTLPEDLVQLMTNVDLIKNGKQVKVFETERVQKDGTPILLEVMLSPVKNERGDVVGISTIARDLTSFREAQRAIWERDSITRRLEAQEEERRRIARDLHDEVGQQVTSLRFKLRAAKESCNDEVTCSQIDELERIAQEIDNSVDFVAWQLRPPALESASLPDAIANYVRQWRRFTGKSAQFLSRGLTGVHCAPEVETALYRIVQESLNNTHKHAKAESVDLLIEKRGDSIVLVIEDDGVGFDADAEEQRGNGMGLTGMSERALLVGGTLEIDSTPGKGTTIHVKVPCLGDGLLAATGPSTVH